MIRKGLRLDSLIFILPFILLDFIHFVYIHFLLGIFTNLSIYRIIFNYFLRIYPFIELFIISFILRIHPLFYQSIYDFIFSLHFHFFIVSNDKKIYNNFNVV